jgi:dTDP-4-amino-4,6-dideoxygalactose transaminase
MELQELGYNYRLPDILAALGISQLAKATEGLKKRKEIAAVYTKEFAGTVVQTPEYNDGHAFHLYIIQVEKRKALYDYLRENAIFPQVHYIPVHLMPYYRQFGWKKGDFPVSEHYYDRCLSLPMYPTLANDEQLYVINKVKEFFK